jgi:hypothetical protein
MRQLAGDVLIRAAQRCVVGRGRSISHSSKGIRYLMTAGTAAHTK